MWAARIYAQLEKEKYSSDYIGGFYGHRKLRFRKKAEERIKTAVRAQ